MGQVSELHHETLFVCWNVLLKRFTQAIEAQGEQPSHHYGNILAFFHAH